MNFNKDGIIIYTILLYLKNKDIYKPVYLSSKDLASYFPKTNQINKQILITISI